MRALMIAMIVLAVSVESSHSQVDSDNQADTGVLRPAFAQKTGPVVAVDSGHHNYHTIDNRYVPFAALLTNDGFRVVDSKNAFTPGSLAIEKVLVIANAEPVADGEPSTVPTPSAFTAPEIDAVKAWVTSGGSLLLITDHMPFSGAASKLAAAFGLGALFRGRAKL